MQFFVARVLVLLSPYSPIPALGHLQSRIRRGLSLSATRSEEAALAGFPNTLGNGYPSAALLQSDTTYGEREERDFQPR